jgi:predicted dehydrogenase
VTTRVGIVGTGSIAAAHVRAYREVEDVVLAGLCDVVPGRAEAFAGRLGLEAHTVFESVEDMVANGVQAVSVCTPNAAHAAPTIAALEAGADVLVEKPMASSLADALAMVRAAQASGRILSVGFQERYDPNLAMLRALVASGALGRVYYAQIGGGRRRGIPGGSFVRKASAGAGAIADIGCYSLDFVLYLLGFPRPVSVSASATAAFGTDPAQGGVEGFDVEDFGAAFVRFEDGLVLDFKIAWAMHMDSLGATFLLGTKAGLRLTEVADKGVWDEGVGSVTLFHDVAGRPAESRLSLAPRRVRVFDAKVAAFVEAVRGGAPAPVPAEQGLIVQAVIDGILRSAEVGHEVAVAVPEP